MNRQFKFLAAALLATTALCAVEARAEVPTQFINAQTGTTYTVVQSDCGKLVTFSNAASVAVTLPQAGTAGKFFAGCWVEFANKGVGTVTVTPTTSTIGGVASVALTTNKSLKAVSDSTNYQIVPGAGVAAGKSACAGTAAALECNGAVGSITLGTLSMTVGTITTIIFTNSFVASSTNVVLCGLASYSATMGTNGIPTIATCTAGTNTVSVIIGNTGTGTLTGIAIIKFAVMN